MPTPIERQLLELEKSIPNGRGAAETAALLSKDFLEFGRSGRRYTKSTVLASLRTGPPRQIQFTRFLARQVAPGLYLATYRTSIKDGRCTLHANRSSLWKRTNRRWLLLFHQATPTIP